MMRQLLRTRFVDGFGRVRTFGVATAIIIFTMVVSISLIVGAIFGTTVQVIAIVPLIGLGLLLAHLSET